MIDDQGTDETRYTVVVNDEGQYSLWPATTDPPAGWSAAGATGTQAECLAHIESVWTDMRPVSLRRQMEGAAR
jgi:MbtH protein